MGLDERNRPKFSWELNEKNRWVYGELASSAQTLRDVLYNVPLMVNMWGRSGLYDSRTNIYLTEVDLPLYPSAKLEHPDLDRLVLEGHMDYGVLRNMALVAEQTTEAGRVSEMWSYHYSLDIGTQASSSNLYSVEPRVYGRHLTAIKYQKEIIRNGHKTGNGIFIDFSRGLSLVSFISPVGDIAVDVTTVSTDTKERHPQPIGPIYTYKVNLRDPDSFQGLPAEIDIKAGELSDMQSGKLLYRNKGIAYEIRKMAHLVEMQFATIGKSSRGSSRASLVVFPAEHFRENEFVEPFIRASSLVQEAK